MDTAPSERLDYPVRLLLADLQQIPSRTSGPGFYPVEPFSAWAYPPSECSVTLAQKLEELATANADGLLRFARCVLHPARADTLTWRLRPVVMTNTGCFVKTFSRDLAL